ncbi:MAG TPA: chemotaxis protein CheW [Myxococcota bacterium]
MSAGLAQESAGRLLTFAVGGGIYALPIASVLEVTEVGGSACIPTVTPGKAWVVNYHGDALPVVRSCVLLDLAEASVPAPEHVLVITAGSSTSPGFGLPVDRILGLVAGASAAARDREPIAERRPLDGRVANVLDAQRLVAKAREVIEQALARGE